MPSPRRTRFLPSVVMLLAACDAARAQSSVDAEPTALCTDRPTKSNFACTVDAGRFQYEADLVNDTRLRLDGTRTETWYVTNPTIKYGLTKTVDVEANLASWVTVRTRDASGDTSILRGPGDLYLRTKWNFHAGDRLSATILPYVKAPTARRGIGNGATEGGVLFPVNYQLTDKIVLTTVPEFDALKDADNRGHHVNTSQLVNVGISLPNNLTAYAELWGAWNVDPARTVRQFSADVALAWGVTKSFQLDVGFNAGLNRNTPRRQLYFGVSQKF